MVLSSLLMHCDFQKTNVDIDIAVVLYVYRECLHHFDVVAIETITRSNYTNSRFLVESIVSEMGSCCSATIRKTNESHHMFPVFVHSDNEI